MKDKDSQLIYEAHHPSLGDHFTSFLQGKENPDQDTFSRPGPYTKSIYILADGDGVYGAYTEERAAKVAQQEVGGGSYITKVPVDNAPQQYEGS